MARVHVGQIVSICTKLQNKERVTEALLRVKLKFSGSQKLHISKKGDFLNLMQMNLKTFENIVAEKWFISGGYGVKYTLVPGPLAQWWAPALMRALALSPPYSFQ